MPTASAPLSTFATTSTPWSCSAWATLPTNHSLRWAMSTRRSGVPRSSVPVTRSCSWRAAHDGVVLPAQDLERARDVHAHLAAAGDGGGGGLRHPPGVVEAGDGPQLLRGQVELVARSPAAGRRRGPTRRAERVGRHEGSLGAGRSRVTAAPTYGAATARRLGCSTGHPTVTAARHLSTPPATSPLRHGSPPARGWRGVGETGPRPDRPEEDRDALRAAAPDDAGAGRDEGRAAGHDATARARRAADAAAGRGRDAAGLALLHRPHPRGLHRPRRRRRTRTPARARPARLAGAGRHRASRSTRTTRSSTSGSWCCPASTRWSSPRPTCASPAARTTTAASPTASAATPSSSSACGRLLGHLTAPASGGQLRLHVPRHAPLDDERQERHRAGERDEQRAHDRPAGPPRQVDGDAEVDDVEEAVDRADRLRSCAARRRGSAAAPRRAGTRPARTPTTLARIR